MAYIRSENITIRLFVRHLFVKYFKGKFGANYELNFYDITPKTMSWEMCREWLTRLAENELEEDVCEHDYILYFLNESDRAFCSLRAAQWCEEMTWLN